MTGTAQVRVPYFGPGLVRVGGGRHEAGTPRCAGGSTYVHVHPTFALTTLRQKAQPYFTQIHAALLSA